MVFVNNFFCVFAMAMKILYRNKIKSWLARLRKKMEELLIQFFNRAQFFRIFSNFTRKKFAWPLGYMVSTWVLGAAKHLKVRWTWIRWSLNPFQNLLGHPVSTYSADIKSSSARLFKKAYGSKIKSTGTEKFWSKKKFCLSTSRASKGATKVCHKIHSHGDGFCSKRIVSFFCPFLLSVIFVNSQSIR